MGRHACLVVPSAVLAAVSFVSSAAVAAGINDYTLTRTFTLPTPSVDFSNVLFDALPDGRLLAVNGTTVLRETAVRSGQFTTLGTVGNFTAPFGGSFLTVSPDGTRAAIGSNGGGSVTVFNTGTPATATAYPADDYDAEWVDNGRLALTNGNGVQLLNTQAGTVKTIVSNIGGASAGITFDAAGNLYTGNGGGDTPASRTGYVKAVARTAWEAAALPAATPVDFQASGRNAVDLLSAASLGFDASGNFFVGGGELFSDTGDKGYAALVDAAAFQAALAADTATPTIDALSSADVLRKFASPPDTIAGQQPPAWTYNNATGELYLRYLFGDGVVRVYSVPEPASLCGLAALTMAGLRRRRRQVAGTVVLAACASPAMAFDDLDFATEVISSTGLTATGLYNDPQAVLGRPTLRFNNGNAVAPDLRRAKLIEGVFNTGPAGEKLITTFNANQSVTVKMGRPITDDPSHPFGVDFNVFGNTFFTGGGSLVNDNSNLGQFTLSGGTTAERVRVSVSPDNVNWYVYDGRTGDGFFPTNAYRYDRTAAAFTDEQLDPTRPVNPAFANAATFTGISAADALDLYAGSAGGAGFDLAASGFASVQYVRFDGTAVDNFFGGEIDAVARVPEPAALAILAITGVGLLRRR